MDQDLFNVLRTAVSTQNYGQLRELLESFDETPTEVYNVLFECASSPIIDAQAFTLFLMYSPFLHINRRIDDLEETILHKLAKNHHIEQISQVLKLYQTDVRVNSKCVRRKSPLMVAAEYGHLDIVKLLRGHFAAIDLKDSLGNTALHWAAKEARLDVVKCLVEENMDVNEINIYGDNALSLSVRDVETFKYLLENGGDLFMRDKRHQNILHRAAFHDSIDTIQAILERISSEEAASLANATKNSGTTPLLFAVRNGNLDMVKLLLDIGADIEQTNSKRQTPLIAAAHKDYAGMRVEEDDVYLRHKTKWVPKGDHYKVVEYLLKKGANVATKDYMGNTALMLAADAGYANIISVLVNPKWRADIDCYNKKRETALMMACKKGHFEAARILIVAGADITAVNARAQSALDLATTLAIKNLLKEFL